ncbi:MAG: FAD-dependent oxidoreductase [Euryarchaeota archaeon]|nr:FAD-dependent oxidoreductase [Euryarchaeota archaeon]
MKKDLIAVRTGPAGISTWMYAVRSGLETLVLDKGICGGLSNELEEVKKVESKAEEMTVITKKDSYLTKGEEPVNGLATQMGIKMDKRGYIITDKSQRTNLERVYAAGDITGGVRQIVVASAEGAIAATSAYDDLLENNSNGIK